jgi:uncharacterized hydrophobic protein (TIGR00271 family)
MNALAATIASYGLFANSPAVVIGAMLVALLMGPIVGVSLALVDSDAGILLKSLLSLLSGVVGVLVTAFIIGAVHKDMPITSEIIARTAPNFLDLMIALAGGAAGAYATVSFRLSLALVGVAIATGKRSGCQNITLALTSFDGVPCRHGHAPLITTGTLGTDSA